MGQKEKEKDRQQIDDSCALVSITCGVAAKNVDTPYFTREQFKEYRGLSFTMGGVSFLLHWMDSKAGETDISFLG